MKNFRLTWTNIIIVILLNYAIGEVLLSAKVYVVKELDRYEQRKNEERLRKFEEELEKNREKSYKEYQEELKKYEE